MHARASQPPSRYLKCVILYCDFVACSFALVLVPTCTFGADLDNWKLGQEIKMPYSCLKVNYFFINIVKNRITGIV